MGTVASRARCGLQIDLLLQAGMALDGEGGSGAVANPATASTSVQCPQQVAGSMERTQSSASASAGGASHHGVTSITSIQDPSHNMISWGAHV